MEVIQTKTEKGHQKPMKKMIGKFWESKAGPQ